MELTLTNYLGVALFLAKLESFDVITKEIFDKTKTLFEDKEPSKLWKWQRDNRLARKQYKLPDVLPINTSEISKEEKSEYEIETIIAQFRTSLDLLDYKISFIDGTKIHISHDLINTALDKLLELKPTERLLAQSFCLESLNNLMSFIDYK
jgi:hypothetical protein